MAHRSTLAAAAILLAAACTTSPSLQDCAADADCGAGNVCHAGSCAANAPPVADLDVPASVTTNRLLSLIPSASDPEGRPVATRWTVLATAGGCAPDVEPQDGPALEVVFWCAGTYEARLVPIDDQGLEGTTVVRSLEVTPASGAPSVTVAPAIAATHVCDAAASTCTVEGPDGSPSLQLGAVAADPGSAPLSYQWIALPPAFALEDPTLLVAFLTSTADDAPIAAIGNGSGGPIAGTYRFRVRVSNPDGLLAQAFQEVVVANEAPTGASGGWELPHAYVDGAFVAEGEVPSGAVDPDGDALIVQGALAPTPPASCTEAVTAGVTPGSVRVRIACTLPADLIGAEPRTLTATITDANGAALAISAPLVIANRPPRIDLDPSLGGALSLEHRVEPCQLLTAASCFVVDGPDPFLVTDPDGDPLAPHLLGASVGAARPSSRGTVTLDGTLRRFRFETSVGAPAEFRSPSGASGFSLTASQADPWGATASVEAPLTIQNRKPILEESVGSVSVPHVYDASTRRYRASATGALFRDPDGDPLVLTGSAPPPCSGVTLEAGRITITCERAWDYTLGGLPPLDEFLATAPNQVTVSDGWEGVASGTWVHIQDRPATVSAPTTTSESCACVSGFSCTREYSVSKTGVTLPVALVDPDGDPAQIAVYANLSPTAPVPVTCLPGWCYPKVDGASTSSIHGSVVGKTGGLVIPPVEALFSVTPTCAAAGTCCP
jgi:hypothetical protein